MNAVYLKKGSEDMLLIRDFIIDLLSPKEGWESAYFYADALCDYLSNKEHFEAAVQDVIKMCKSASSVPELKADAKAILVTLHGMVYGKEVIGLLETSNLRFERAIVDEKELAELDWLDLMDAELLFDLFEAQTDRF